MKKLNKIEEEIKWLELLKEELKAESRNGMKKIAKDWYKIRPIYEEFRYKHRLTPNESFHCALAWKGYKPLIESLN